MKNKFEEWLETATIKELLEQFEMRCHTIVKHELNKEAYDDEDCVRSQEMNYMSHGYVAESAQNDLDKLKAEIALRTKPKEIDEEKLRKTLKFFQGLTEEHES